MQAAGRILLAGLLAISVALPARAETIQSYLARRLSAFTPKNKHNAHGGNSNSGSTGSSQSSGSGSVTTSGNGSVILSRGTNTFTGNTIVTSGILDLPGTGSVAGGIIQAGNGTTIVTSGNINSMSPSHGLVTFSAGTLTLNSGAFNNGWLFGSGTLQVGGTNVSPASGTVTFIGTNSYTGTTNIGGTSSTDGTYSGGLTVSSGTFIGTATGPGTFGSGEASFNDSTASQIVQAGGTFSAGTITWAGPTQLTNVILSGTNTYTGRTLINNGTLQVIANQQVLNTPYGHDFHLATPNSYQLSDEGDWSTWLASHRASQPAPIGGLTISLLQNSLTDFSSLSFAQPLIDQLNSALDSSGSGWSITQVWGIDTAGNLAANALAPDGSNRAVILSTVPEPAAILLAGCGLAALAAAGLRRRSRRL